MLLSLLALLSSQPSVTPRANPAADPDPPIHVWLNSDGNYLLGDHAKAYVRAGQGGYLVVLHAAPDGRVRVLFPIDPGNDQRIQARKKYELKGRAGHEAFMVDDTTGHGTVLAALASTPFRFDDFAQNGRWDYQALSGRRPAGDAEAELMSIVQRMKGDGHFDYDVASYVAGGSAYARYGYPYGYPWWGYGPSVGLGFWFGPSYPYRWGYGYRGGRWRW
jgi:hypothetical protein